MAAFSVVFSKRVGAPLGAHSQLRELENYEYDGGVRRSTLHSFRVLLRHEVCIRRLVLELAGVGESRYRRSPCYFTNHLEQCLVCNQAAGRSERADGPPNVVLADLTESGGSPRQLDGLAYIDSAQPAGRISRRVSDVCVLLGPAAAAEQASTSGTQQTTAATPEQASTSGTEQTASPTAEQAPTSGTQQTTAPTGGAECIRAGADLAQIDICPVAKSRERGIR